MVAKETIICPHCKKDTKLDYKNYTHRVIPQGGIHCPYCGGVIDSPVEYKLYGPPIVWSYNGPIPPNKWVL